MVSRERVRSASHPRAPSERIGIDIAFVLRRSARLPRLSMTAYTSMVAATRTYELDW